MGGVPPTLALVVLPLSRTVHQWLLRAEYCPSKKAGLELPLNSVFFFVGSNLHTSKLTAAFVKSQLMLHPGDETQI